MKNGILNSTKSGAAGVVISTGKTKYDVVATFTHNGRQFYVGAHKTSWGTGYEVLAWDPVNKKYFRHS